MMFANFQTLIPLLAVVQLATGQAEQLAGVAGLDQENIQNHDIEESSFFARLRDFYGGSATPNLLQPEFKGESVKDTAMEENAVYGLDQYYSGNRQLNTKRELDDHDYDYDYEEDPVDCVGKGKGKGGCTCMSMSYDYSKGKGGSADYTTKGKDGSKGSKGKDGSKGSKGTDGKDGSKGSKGTDGKDGSKGSKGTDGKDGSKGSKGTDGKDGSKGSKGTDGKDGSKGSKGKGGGKGMDSEYELDYTYRERQLSAVEASAQGGGVYDSAGTHLRSGTPAAGTAAHIERRDEYDDYTDNAYPDGGSPGKGDSSKGSKGKGESSKGSKGKGDSSKGSKGKGDSSKGKGHEDDCVCEEDYDGKGEGKGSKGSSKGSKGESSKGSKGKGSKGDSSKGEDYGKGDDECDICPVGDLTYVFEPMRLNWTEHLARVRGIEGCYFAAIRNQREQQEVADLIVDELGFSGRDFVYLGGEICDGTVTPTFRGTNGGADRDPVTDSEWCWADFPELQPFGAGSEANENSLGYQNWGEAAALGGRFPNNFRNEQGKYMGLYTAAVRTTLQFTWDDHHRRWPAIYECCPDSYTR